MRRLFKSPALRRPTRLAMGERGQSLTEFALTLPLLLVILFGTLDLGRLYFAHVTLTNASREGARYGISNPTDPSSIQTRVFNEGSHWLTPSTITISIVCAPYDMSQPYDAAYCSSALKGDRLRVTVTYNFEFVTLYILGLHNITLSNFTTMAIVNGQ